MFQSGTYRITVNAKGGILNIQMPAEDAKERGEDKCTICRYNMATTVSGSARAPLFVLLGTASVEPPAHIGRGGGITIRHLFRTFAC